MKNTIKVVTNEGFELTLGEVLPKGYESHGFSTALTDKKGKLNLVEIPMGAFSHIELNGVKYECIFDIMSKLELKFSYTLVACSTGGKEVWQKLGKSDYSKCPFGCHNVEGCEQYCYDVLVYRGTGKDKLGFDMAQPAYNHGLECIVIAKPGESYKIG